MHPAARVAGGRLAVGDDAVAVAGEARTGLRFQLMGVGFFVNAAGAVCTFSRKPAAVRFSTACCVVLVGRVGTPYNKLSCSHTAGLGSMAAQEYRLARPAVAIAGCRREEATAHTACCDVPCVYACALPSIVNRMGVAGFEPDASTTAKRGHAGIGIRLPNAVVPPQRA